MIRFFRNSFLATSLIAVGSTSAVPVSFQPGNLVKSTEVNANFAYLDSVTKAQASLISGLSASLKDMQSKWSADSLAQAKKAKADSGDLSAYVLKSMPVGSVIGSTVIPGADGSLPGTNATWIFAAGQPGPKGDTLVDLRGAFLRGIDYPVSGRNQNNRDPSGQRKAGDFQQDQFQDHSHWNGMTDDYTSAFPQGVLLYPNATVGIQNENAGGTMYQGKTSSVIPATASIGVETRPKNSAVYWYIKVK